MENAVKALDLRRDSRYALHSLSPEAGWTGDAKIAGRVVVRLGEPADHLVIESWHEGRGTERRRRR